ncbi:MAG: ATP-binding protein [Acidobacteriota bacterium]
MATNAYEARIPEILQTLGEVIFELDATGDRVLCAGPGFEALVGVETGARGIAWLARVVKDDRSRFQEALRASRVDGQEHVVVHGLHTRDGGRRRVRTVLRAMKAPDGITFAVRSTGIAAPDEDLAGGQTRLAFLLSNVPDILWTTDQSMRILTSEGAGLSILGLKAGQVVGMRIPEFVAGSEAEQLANAAHQAALDGRATSYESDFSGRSYSVHVEPLRDGAGTVVGTIGLAMDVTERRRAEGALRESEMRLRMLINQMPDILWTTDRDLKITSCVGSGLGNLGLEPAPLVGQPLSALLPTGTKSDATMAAHQAALAGRSSSFDREWQGRAFTVHVEPFFDAYGLIGGTIGLALDITERKRAEQTRDRLLAEEQEARRAAEESEERAAFLADASKILVGALDFESAFSGVARLTVPYLADFCVFDVLEEDGSISRMAVAHGESRRGAIAQQLVKYSPDPAAPEGVPKVMRTGQAEIYTGVREALQKIGNAGPDQWPPVGTRNLETLRLLRVLNLCSYMTVPLVGRGRTLGTITFAADNEERRYGPADLALAEDLARRCALVIDNARLYERAQEAIRIREEFLSIASHELRTPITSLQLAVQNSLDMLQSGAPAGSGGERFARSLLVAERQTRRLGRLVEALLDVSRIQAGRLNLTLAEIDLADIVRDVLRAFDGELRAAGCALSLAIGPAVGYWDAGRLEQVVTNLLGNALKYGAGRPIHVGVSAVDGGVGLTVKDHGIGIASERLSSIFDPFERAVSAEHFGGLGLGLYIVKNILEAHGGSIHVESDLGRGSTFHVELPRRAPTPSHPEAEA